MSPTRHISLRSRMRLFVLAGLAMVATASAAQAYRGFTIDDSRVRDQPNLAAILTATREQIDIVHAVGLPADILAFLASVPFELVPPGTFKTPTPGRYTGKGDRRVQVSAAIINTGHKPVLLHELMHAFHDQRIERGYGNQTILGFFKSAQAIPVYAARSHMMANDREYFACAATTYLFGVTAQEPFRRDKVREQQPGFHDFLKKTFGPDAGSYAGSLTR